MTAGSFANPIDEGQALDTVASELEAKRVSSAGRQKPAASSAALPRGTISR